MKLISTDRHTPEERSFMKTIERILSDAEKKGIKQADIAKAIGKWRFGCNKLKKFQKIMRILKN